MRYSSIETQGSSDRYGQQMAELVPALLERFQAQPVTILDLACAEGTFVLQMARQGYQVSGMDTSPLMLEYAQDRAREENLDVSFFQQDLKTLNQELIYDLITCWNYSLNYVLEWEELKETFFRVRRALRAGGIFIFDMNTIYGLAVSWQWKNCYVQFETEENFEVHRPSYDYETNKATLRIAGFRRKEDLWQRTDDEVHLRGYTFGEMRQALHDCGLVELVCYGDPWKMTPPRGDSGRVWFVARNASPYDSEVGF